MEGRTHQTVVALTRLTKRQIGEMMRGATGKTDIPPDVVEQVADRTDGVPLFVEEFARVLLEGGNWNPGSIPATLQDLLLARLDRMASNKDVVQVGAAIGRTFSYELLRAAAELDPSALRAELDKLVGAGVLFAKGTPPRDTYTFKHALIQDAAYQSLVKKRRQQVHLRIAEALERAFPDAADTQPEVLAHHFTEAGRTESAIEYWRGPGIAPASGRPTPRRSATSRAGWSCSPPSRRGRTATPASSGCGSRSVRATWPPAVTPRRRSRPRSSAPRPV